MSFDDFVGSVGERVRRALVASYGVEIGTDAAGDAMRVAWERWSEVGEMANPAGFLFRVGQSHARPYLRWRRRRVDFPASTPAGRLDADRAEFSEVLEALHQLGSMQRAAVVLVRSYQYTYSEAAEVLDISEAAVTNHLHRGMKKLREILGVSL